ncbi:MAG: hypothetical protein AB1299_04520 [Thermoproteota archaeon]|jgi:chromosome segregation ATPase
MGLFRRAKKEEPEDQTASDVQIKTPEQIQKEQVVNELEYLRKELSSKTEHLNSISDKLIKVKDEYDHLVGTLMTSKRELNEHKAKHQEILQQIESAKAELISIKKQVEAERTSLDELQKARSELESMKSQYLKYKEEADKLKSLHESFEQIKKSQQDATKELEQIRKEHESKKKEIEIAKKELKFIEDQMANVGNRTAPKNVVAAASSVVSSLNSKLLATQKELEMLKIALQRERTEHQETKNKLDALLKEKKG